MEEMQQSANSRQRINEEHFPADEGYYNTQGLAFGLAGCYRIDPNLYRVVKEDFTQQFIIQYLCCEMNRVEQKESCQSRKAALVL